MEYEIQFKSLIKEFDKVGRVFFRSELNLQKMLDDSDNWEYTYMNSVNSIIEEEHTIRYNDMWDSSKFLESTDS